MLPRKLGQIRAAVMAFAVIASTTSATEARMASRRFPVGCVTDISKSMGEDVAAKKVEVRRAGRPLDIDVGAVLFAGDNLQVSRGATVTIETLHERQMHVTSDRSPQLIGRPAFVPAHFREIAAAICPVFKTENNGGFAKAPDGAPLQWLTRFGSPQKIVARSTLLLDWQGGVPPFKIELTGQTGMRRLDIAILASATSSTNSVEFALPPAAQGNLRLLVRDATANEISVLLLTDPVSMPRNWDETGFPTTEFAEVAKAVFLLRDHERSFDLLTRSVANKYKAYAPGMPQLFVAR